MLAERPNDVRFSNLVVAREARRILYAGAEAGPGKCCTGSDGNLLGPQRQGFPIRREDHGLKSGGLALARAAKVQGGRC